MLCIAEVVNSQHAIIAERIAQRHLGHANLMCIAQTRAVGQPVLLLDAAKHAHMVLDTDTTSSSNGFVRSTHSFGMGRRC